ncbi:MAG: flavin-containing monooxygenase [Actinomycetota bacterium]
MEDLAVFQRTPSWIVPRRDVPYSERRKRLFRHVPGAESLHRLGIFWFNEKGFLAFRPGQRWWGLIQGSDRAREWEGVALRNLERQVPDPELRAKLTPDYGIGCKRVLLSNDWYPTLQRDDVELVTDRITRITGDAIETEAGTVGPLDAIILGTGFDSTKFMSTVEITGADGVRLADAWRDGPQAHLGITVAGFPNLFMLYGPNTNLGHGTIIFMIECQIRYVRKCVQRMRRDRLRVLAVRPEAQERFNARLQDDLARSVWASGSRSWYVTADGSVRNNWSGFMLDYWRDTLRPDFDDFSAA